MKEKKKIILSHDICQECGMPLPNSKHFHPYAACLLFKATNNVSSVENNMDFLINKGYEIAKNEFIDNPKFNPKLIKEIEDLIHDINCYVEIAAEQANEISRLNSQLTMYKHMNIYAQTKD